MVWWDYRWLVGDVEGETSTIDLLYTINSLLERVLGHFAGFSSCGHQNALPEKRDHEA